MADRLWHGESPRHLWGDWLSSDRPPLQSGWLLLTWPVMHALGFDFDTAASTGGVGFQLLWVLAAWSLARHLGATPRQAVGIVAATAFTGVLLEYSVFVWPKLAAAALVVAAYLLWFDAPGEGGLTRFAAGGCCAALGWLAHGGVAFSLLGLVPLALADRRPARWRAWLVAIAGFVAFAAPWSVYQRVYEPPGNRLLKWHLAGVTDIDSRGIGAAMVDSYRRAGFSTALQNKWQNLRMQLGTDWSPLLHVNSLAGPSDLRAGETTYMVRAWAWWACAWLVPLVWLARRGSAPPALPWAAHRATLAWFGAGIAVWLILMFTPNSASIHQGTLCTQLLSSGLLASWTLHFNRWFFASLATVQALWFAVAWAPPSHAVEGRLQALPLVLAALSAAALLWMIWQTVRRPNATRDRA